MDIRQIKEYLGRVKPYHFRNEPLRALSALISGLKGAISIPGGLPTPVRGILREAVQLMSRDELIKKYSANPLSYQPGQERQLLAALLHLYKDIANELSSEDYEIASARKLKLDQALNQGFRSLESGRVSEADEYFQKAISFYRDETRLFFYIGKALIDANVPKRAVPYLRKGLEVNPEDKEMAAQLERANKLIRGEAA